MIILYPWMPNGNVLWSCDNCERTAEVSCFDTNAVALVCICDGIVHPECNNRWYYDGLYWSRKNLSGKHKQKEYK